MSEWKSGDRVKYFNDLKDWGGNAPPPTDWEGWHIGTVQGLGQTIKRGQPYNFVVLEMDDESTVRMTLELANTTLQKA